MITTHLRKKNGVRENTPVIIWIFAMVFSYFIVIPLGTISTVAVTDFRLYDLVFIIGVIFIILPNLKLIINRIIEYKWLSSFFVFSLWIGFTIVVVLILRGPSTALISAARVFRFIAYGLTSAVIVTFIKTQKTLYLLLWFFFILSVLEAGLSILQFNGIVPYLFPPRWYYYGLMPTGTLGPHHLQMGMICAMSSSIGIALLHFEKNIIRKILIAVSIGALIFASFAVESRTGWIGLAIGMAYVLYRLTLRFTFDTLLMIVFIALGIILFYSQSSETMMNQIQDTYSARFSTKIAEGGIGELSPTRVSILRDIPNAILRHPWILVTGAGTQNSVYVLEIGNAAHNNYLHVLIEGGIIGFVLYIRMIFNIFKQSLINFKNSKSRLAKTVLIGFQGAFLVIIFANLYNEAFYFQYATFSLSGQIMALVGISLHKVWVESSAKNSS
ncbi:MAG: O-antigen ligase family protein [Anaerolineaceae bacterium]|jgi:O-antigen ligase